MSRRRKLSKKQIAVIEDLFAGELEEQAVLAKHKVSKNVYNKWVADEIFEAAINQRIRAARLQSEALIARYSLVAAAKLVQLTESDKEETARKACLDIISRPNHAEQKQREADENRQEPPFDHAQDGLDDETTSRILAVLAEEKR